MSNAAIGFSNSNCRIVQTRNPEPVHYVSSYFRLNWPDNPALWPDIVVDHFIGTGPVFVKSKPLMSEDGNSITGFKYRQQKTGTMVYVYNI